MFPSLSAFFQYVASAFFNMLPLRKSPMLVHRGLAASFRSYVDFHDFLDSARDPEAVEVIFSKYSCF